MIFTLALFRRDELCSSASLILRWFYSGGRPQVVPTINHQYLCIFYRNYFLSDCHTIAYAALHMPRFLKFLMICWRYFVGTNCVRPRKYIKIALFSGRPQVVPTINHQDLCIFYRNYFFSYCRFRYSLSLRLK